MKKFLSLIIVLILFSNNNVFANTKYQQQINMVSNKIKKIMINKPFNKVYIYLSTLENIKNSANPKTIDFIDKVLQNIKQKYHRNTINLILKIDKNYSNKTLNEIINKNKDKIINSDNIFIFKNNLTGRFSASQMLYVSKKLNSLNNKIRIFIDQEGGMINRFNDFDKINTFDNYINSNLSLKYKYAVLSQHTKDLISNAFRNRTTFISMNSFGEIYYSIKKTNLSERNRFLDFITFFRLYTLQKNGINTYGIVCDLDKGNPIISGYKRSFTDDTDDYISLGKYFIKNARILGISLYLKHFPGHGKGNIDSHKTILKYTDNKFDKKYIFDNMSVFEAILYHAKKSGVELGIMTAHAVLPNSIEKKFFDILKKSDYILTDDLGMSAYTKQKDKELKDKFFSTNLILKNFNVIKVYTQENQIK